VIFCLVYWLYYERIMFAEEQFLRRKFGEVYDKWSEKTGSFIPSSIKYIKSKLSFSIRNVLKREYNSFVNIFVIFFLLDIFRNFYLSERLYFTRIWLILFIAAVIIWAIIRSIHKYTKWLEVEGR
jgi:protein-S-isoprenylcysteine O-methyltransferase Ste14